MSAGLLSIEARELVSSKGLDPRRIEDALRSVVVTLCARAEFGLPRPFTEGEDPSAHSALELLERASVLARCRNDSGALRGALVTATAVALESLIHVDQLRPPGGGRAGD